jgi:prepilin-type N-terminal cleavage/methylation domain-containing protein
MNKKGFTLIELLIVVAVIGILASVVLVGLGPVQKQGRDARRISDLRQVQNGLELYYSKNGSYPRGGVSWTDFSKDLKDNGGISNVPKDPRSPSVEYQYWATPDKTSYCIGAKLEDLTNPNWRTSSPCDNILGTGCYDGNNFNPPTSIPTTNNYYCVSL